MACYHPIPALQTAPGAAVQLWPPIGTATLSLPCGTCLGCRARRAVEWSRRCTHEAKRFAHNCFLTLTYEDTHLPEHGFLDKVALTRFFKRVRRRADYDKMLVSDRSCGIRYVACGEYGELNDRPHYHILMFNLSFGDLQKCGSDVFESRTLGALWPFGGHQIGALTPASATYVAKYTMKNTWTGDRCLPTGEVIPRPFLHMSRRPAIGATFVERYSSDLKGGFLVVDGVKMGIPRTYKRLLEKYDPAFAEEVEYRAWLGMVERGGDSNDPARLADAEKIHINRKEREEFERLSQSDRVVS